MSLESVNLWTPVTALHCLGQVLFAGISNKLEVYSITDRNRRLICSHLTKFVRIHGIISCSGDEKVLLAVYGNRFLDLFDCKFNNDNLEVTLCPTQTQVFMKDWIQTAQFVNETFIACVTSNNRLVIYDIASSSISNIVECDVRCILYSALLIDFPSSEEFFIASGTVFKQIIVWSYAKQQTHLISTLDGHSGVIFALEYCKNNRKLFSASDDRSIRIWDHIYEGSGCDKWKTSQFYPSHILYGHESRIWRLLRVNEILVSCGENNNLCIWNPNNGKLLWKNPSESSSLWSVAASPNSSLIFLGSSDGSIRVVSARDEVVLTQNQVFKFTGTYPKFIKLFPENLILCITNDGKISLLEVSESNLITKKSHYLGKEYESYCIASSDKYHIFCFNQKGGLKILSNEFEELEEIVLFSGKIFSSFYLSNSLETSLIASGPLGEVCLINDRKVSRRLSLPSSKHSWATCGFTLEDYIVLGDRSGRILVFGDHSEAIQILNNVHSSHGVNDLKFNSESKLIFSCGRDGKVNEYIWNSDENKLNFLRLYPINIGYDWFDRILFDKSYKMCLVGFYGSKCILWREQDQAILWNIECGGGNRQWDVKIRPDELRFCFIKHGELIHHQKPLNRLVLESPLIRPRFHSHKINCCTLLNLSGSKAIIATGGEDNKILIEELMENNELCFVQTLSGHISSVRTLSSCKLAKETLLISGGGRSQLMVWSIRVNANKVYTKLLDNHFNWKAQDLAKKHWKDFEIQPDTQVRYLASQIIPSDKDLLIVMACSDGCVRVFSFDRETEKVRFVHQSKVSNFCPLSLSSMDDILLVGTSDGRISFWKVQSLSGNLTLEMVYETICHQSGVNCIQARIENDKRWLIFSSGDDTRLTLLMVERARTLNLIGRTSIECAHNSLVSSILTLGSNHIITVSVDERICLWKYCIAQQDKSCLDLSFVSKFLCQVTDASSALCYHLPCKNFYRIIVTGHGLEAFDLKARK